MAAASAFSWKGGFFGSLQLTALCFPTVISQQLSCTKEALIMTSRARVSIGLQSVECDDVVVVKL